MRPRLLPAVHPRVGQAVRLARRVSSLLTTRAQTPSACSYAQLRRAPAAATCPVCRAPLSALSSAKGEAARLDATSVTCSCGVRVKLAKARAHTAKCAHVAAAAAATKSALQSGRIIAGAGPAAEVRPLNVVPTCEHAPTFSDASPLLQALAAAAEGAAGPNRSTFDCPLCPASATTARHLDCNALVEHVRAKHKTDGRSAVCPVCAAMPWCVCPKLASCFAVLH